MPIEHIVEFGTLIGGGISAYAYLPQINSLLKTKNVKGHSLSAWLLWLLGIALALVYSIYIKDWVFISFNAVNFLCIIVIIFLIYKYKPSYEN